MMEETFGVPGVGSVMGLLHHLTDLQAAINMRPNLDPQTTERLEAPEDDEPLEKVLGLMQQLGDFQHIVRVRRGLGGSEESFVQGDIGDEGGGHLLEGLVEDNPKGLVLALFLVIAGLCVLVAILVLLLCCSFRRRTRDLERGVVDKGEKSTREGRTVLRRRREKKSRERRSRERITREENQFTSESSETSPVVTYSFPPQRPAGPPLWVPPSPPYLNTSGTGTPRSTLSTNTPRSTRLQPTWHHSDFSGWCPGPPCGVQKVLEPTSLL